MRELQRLNMVRNQCKPTGVENEKLLEAMMTIPREDFLLDPYKELAYSDGEWPSIDGHLMSRPEMQGQLLEAAEIAIDDKIIIIGSSYLAAVASLIANKVLALNGNPLLSQYGVELSSLNFKEIANYQGYNKVIVERLLLQEELNDLLQLKDCEIFYPESQGEQVLQKLIRYKSGQKEILGEIFCL